MIEFIFEFSLCLVVMFIMLYFFCKLTKDEMVISKVVCAVLIVSIIQYSSEFIEMNKVIRGVLEDIIIISFLFSFAKVKDKQALLYAISINVIFTTITVVLFSIVSLTSIEIDTIMNFGIGRIIFCAFHIICCLFVFSCIIHPLLWIHNEVESIIFNRVVIAITLISLCLNYILQLSEENKDIIAVTCIVILVLMLIYLIVIRYCIEVNKTNNSMITQKMMELTENHILALEEEYQEIRKIRHDMNSQFMIAQRLCTNENYNELEVFLADITNYKDSINKLISTGNTYVDAILNQKMMQFHEIKFDVDIKLAHNFTMNTRNLTSLLVNIIDNACEELIFIGGNKIHLTIKGDAVRLHLTEYNDCSFETTLKSRKNSKRHGYGLKIIRNIVNTYNGSISISKKSVFLLEIDLLF